MPIWKGDDDAFSRYNHLWWCKRKRERQDSTPSLSFNPHYPDCLPTRLSIRPPSRSLSRSSIQTNGSHTHRLTFSPSALPILFYFIFFCCCVFVSFVPVCTFQRVAKGKRKKKKSNTSALMAVRVSRQRTKKEKPPCRFGRPTVSQPRHDIVDLIGQAVSERHLYIIF